MMRAIQTTINEQNSNRCMQITDIDANGINIMKETSKSRAEELKIIKKYPIYCEWVNTLVKTNADLLQRVHDLEQKCGVIESEADSVSTSNTLRSGKRLNINGNISKVGQIKMAEKGANSKNSKNVVRSGCGEPNMCLLNNEKRVQITNSDECQTVEIPSHNGSTCETILLLKRCLSNLFKLPSKQQQQLQTKEATPAKSSVNHLMQPTNYERPCQTEFIYVDRSVCCVINDANTKQSVRIQSLNNDPLCMDIKSSCSEQMHFLKNISNICTAELQGKNDLIAAQMYEIQRLKDVLADYNQLKQINSLLQNNIEAIAVENTNIILESKLLKKNLRKLCKKTQSVEK